MSCSCGGKPGESAKYQLTTPDGVQRVFLSETEARAGMSLAGGGTIERIS